MNNRRGTLGVKQVIRLEWMQKVVNLKFAGLHPDRIREELHEFIGTRKGSGASEGRGAWSTSQVVNILMKAWISPAFELGAFREEALNILRNDSSMALPIHWTMMSAIYPFWFNVSCQTGRLFALQGQVSQAQIIRRLKEQYGDRESVSRFGRCVLRSLVAWGILRDTERAGCYERSASIEISEEQVAILMFESALWATPDSRISLDVLRNHPAFFPFNIPLMGGETIASSSSRIQSIRYGLDHQMLSVCARTRDSPTRS